MKKDIDDILSDAMMWLLAIFWITLLGGMTVKMLTGMFGGHGRCEVAQHE